MTGHYIDACLSPSINLTLNPTEYKKLKPPVWRANRWEYFISFSAIAVGFGFQFLVLTTDWPKSKNHGTIPNGLTERQFASIFFFLYLIGIYGLWRIHAGYKFIKLKSPLSIEAKQKVVALAFDRMNKKMPAMSSDSITIRYKGFLWSVFIVTILLDEENIYINAQYQKDHHGGMIDFGDSYRVMRKIRRNMEVSMKSSVLENK
jgi:hypothetical protein